MTDDFEGFVQMIDPQLRHALSGHLPAQEVADAVAESFAYAWEHWARVQSMENPAGYLYRVAESKARVHKQGFLPWPSDSSMPDYEPGLVPALDELSPSQQRAVWLVHGCGWTYAETAVALDMSASTVGTHVSRGMENLRARLGYPSMDELERQLRDLAARRASQVPEFDATALTSGADDDGPNWGVLLAVAALIVALLVGGGYLLFGNTDDDNPRVVAAPSSSDAAPTTVPTTMMPPVTTTEPAVVPPTNPPPTVPSCSPSGNDTLPQSGSGNATPPPLAQQQGATVRNAPCVSQVVFTFTAAMPDWIVGYQSGPLELQPSGQPVSVAGNAFLVVRFDHANAFTVPTSPAIDSPIVREIKKTQDFEGVVTWVIGLDMQRPFGVSTDAAGHVTIDVEV